MTHELKTWPEPFAALWRGEKHHEIRRADRPFAVGDTLILREWDPARAVNDRYTGRSVAVVVTYISSAGTWGLPEQLCVMSVEARGAADYGIIAPRYLDPATGEDVPTCRECGSLTSGGRCANCGKEAGR